MNVPIEQCRSAHVYKSAPIRRIFYLIGILCLYALSIPYCLNTVGEPRAAAISRAQDKDDAKWADVLASHDENDEDDNDNEKNNMKNILSTSSSSSSSNPKEFKSKVVEIEYDEFGEPLAVGSFNLGGSGGILGGNTDEDEIELPQTFKVQDVGSGGMFGSWFMSADQKAARKKSKEESEKLLSKFREAAGEDLILPPWYLPSAWACLSLFATLTLHALFFLLCHWLVSFKALALYKPTEEVVEGAWVLVRPPINRGKAALVEVKRALKGGELKIEFQRQSYKYVSPHELRKSPLAKEFPNGVWQLATCPVGFKVEHYATSTGVGTKDMVETLLERWGPNHVAVQMPSFAQMLINQLLSPLAIFQVFCALLWLLDEYWTYTLWSLVSVVIFEAVTVFQRNKTLKMLGGMAPKTQPIWVYRLGKWQLLITKDLLPGDIMSITSASASGPTTGTTGTTGNTEKKDGNDNEDTNDTTTDNNNNNNVNSNARRREMVVPCDCLLLTGGAVVNEASLTGESVPQMKEAVSFAGADGEVRLDMHGNHRVSVLFSGTSVISVSRNSSTSSMNAGSTGLIPTAPDGGVIVYVLRTGFSSSQGSLIQMIEYSQNSVSGDAFETGMALLLLLFFALIASAYVLKDGLERQEKTQHELLLKCVIIITSVVPRQLPMQMAMAVNMALMAMMKGGIFCTEPYRVPLAGKISHCLFDKTGTLTTDQLVPAGLIVKDASALQPQNASIVNVDSDGKQKEGVPLVALDRGGLQEASVVLAACHSLVTVTNNNSSGNGSDANKGELVGDPIELAALEGIGWSWNGTTNTATPGDTSVIDKKIAAAEKNLQATKERGERYARGDFSLPPEQQSLLPTPPPTPDQQRAMVRAVSKQAEMLTQRMNSLNQKRRAVKEQAFQDEKMCESITILHRNYFNSGLQRMSVIAKCHGGTLKNSSSNKSGLYSLVKGSPEAIHKLLTKDNIPPRYEYCYRTLAKRGLRVLALAYKPLSVEECDLFNENEQSQLTREQAESNLRFCGFIAFECKIRSDSGVVVASLKEAGHKVGMLTGDSPLTSIHVARVGGIVHRTKPVAVLTKIEEDDKISWEWCLETETDDITDTESKSLPFDLKSITQVARDYDLVSTEQDFVLCAGPLNSSQDNSIANSGESDALAALNVDNLWFYAGLFKVFARMSPRGKADVIRAIQKQSNQHNVLMCGDGGNDVGALKEACVGMALLAGHANANTTDDALDLDFSDAGSNLDSENSDTNAEASGVGAEDLLNAHSEQLKRRQSHVEQLRKAHMKRFQDSYVKKQQADMQRKLKEITEKGEYMKMLSLFKDQAVETKNAINKENRRFMALHGQVWDPKKDDADNAQDASGMMSMLGMGDGAESGDGMDTGKLPMLRPGDASVAAPFTSRTPSVRSVVDLIRQGRCTLLSALMQQQIMMLESIIAAYTLSALALNNARSSERQMMASSWLIITAAMSFSYASPVDKMHPQRPLNSLFSPAIIFSIFGQAIIHIACMTFAVQWATDAMGPEKLEEVKEFFKKAKAKQLDQESLCEEDDMMCQFNLMWQAPFLPNILNSTVFLVETSQMISVYFANYKGRPWMKGMLENHPLFLSVFICIAGVVVASWEMIPQLNEALQLTPFPDDTYRYKVVFLVCMTIAGTFLWDRICCYIFSKKIFQAMTAEAKNTSMKDVMPILATAGKIVAGVLVIGTGNFLLAGIGYWYYTSWQKKRAAAMQQS